MKRAYQIISVYLIVEIVIFPCVAQAETYGGGSGTPEDPYLIWTPEQMNTIGANSDDWSAHFKLMADIDMSIYTGTQYNVIGNETTPFTGTFDGDSRTISNLTISGSINSGKDNIGLFGWVGSGGQVKNLCMINASITGRYNIANFIGTNFGTISQCHADGFTLAAWGQVGGIVGMNYPSGTIHRCYIGATGFVWGNAGDTGGITGYECGTITQCYVACPVSSNTTYAVCTGGLVGYCGGKIYQSYARGSVTGTNYVGGLGGYLHGGYVYQSFATSTVTGNGYVGGLCGMCSYSELFNCYSTGLVSGFTNVGGLGGDRVGSIISSCFWDIETSDQTTSFIGTGKTTAEMKILSTFTSATWDFVGESTNGTADIWRMCSNGMDYPRLSWEISQGGDFDCPDGVALDDLLYLSAHWLATNPDAIGSADPTSDGKVDILDLGILAEQWLKEE